MRGSALSGVHLSIAFDQGQLSLAAGFEISLFHANHQPGCRGSDIPEEVSIIHFPGPGLLATEIVAALEDGDFVAALVEGRDNVSGGDLLVMHAVEDLPEQ
jgi:hypothetical protein